MSGQREEGGYAKMANFNTETFYLAFRNFDVQKKAR